MSEEMVNLFGSGSDNSNDNNMSSPERGSDTNEQQGDNDGPHEEMQSTQSQMQDLFGAESDASKDSSDSAASSDERNAAEPKGSPDVNSDEPKEENSDEEGRDPPQQASSDSDSDMGIGRNKSSTGVGASAAPTTQDLFGEDVSSDEETQDKPSTSFRPDISPLSGDEDSMRFSERRIPSPSKDKEDEEEEDEGLSISIELPRCNISLGKELYFVKLPNFLSVDTKPFDSNYYEDISSDEDEILDEEGRARLKLKVENTIRWRYSKDKDGEEIKESNCRFVRWSDGSLSMHLGNEVFDVFKMKVDGEQNHLFVQQGTGLQAQAVFKNKLSFRPHSTTSQTHRKMTQSIADRMNKAQKVKMMPAMEKDPESQRESALKKEDERLRAANRRESQQRRMREKSHLKGLSSGYLNDNDDDDGYENSIAAIKADYKNKKRRPLDIYDDDEDEESEDSAKEDRLRKAKQLNDDDEDDDGDEFDADTRRKRDELATRKKKAGRKIIESDEDSDAESD